MPVLTARSTISIDAETRNILREFSRSIAILLMLVFHKGYFPLPGINTIGKIV